MAKNVRFVQTTKQKWLDRDVYDPLALYFCMDTGEIFKGDVLFTEGVKIVPTREDLPSFECAADGTVYYIADTKAGFMISPDRTGWLQTIYAPVTDVTKIPDGEEYNVVTTVGAVRDIEKAIYAYVDEQVANSGEKLFGDDTSIIIADGAIKIKGFDEAAEGEYLVKGSDGTASWKSLNTTVIDSILGSVETLQTDVADLQSIVGKNASADTEATGLFALINEKANKTDVYTKEEVRGLVSGVYHYRGSKATYADLPTEGQIIGDVWNIELPDAEHGIMPGDNVAWNGTSWDKLAGTIDLSGYVTAEQFAPVKEVVDKIPDYLSTVVKSVSVGGTVLELVDGKIDIPIGAGIKGSDEISVETDGTLRIKSIGVDKIIQNDDEELVLNGGSAV